MEFYCATINERNHFGFRLENFNDEKDHKYEEVDNDNQGEDCAFAHKLLGNFPILPNYISRILSLIKLQVFTEN